MRKQNPIKDKGYSTCSLQGATPVVMGNIAAPTDVTSIEMSETPAAIDGGTKVAFDFNTRIDAMQAVSTAEDNLVYFPNDFRDDKAGVEDRAGNRFPSPFASGYRRLPRSSPG